MQVGRYRFFPPWWGVAATVLFVALFVVAGIWQIQRGQTKERIVTQHQAASKESARPLRSVLAAQTESDMAVLYGRPYQVRGHYDARHQILLDNQPHEGRTGYHVWTALVMQDGRRVLVDRGWIPLGRGGREKPPKPTVPSGQVIVTGLLRDLPKPGVRLGRPPPCDSDQWPRVLNYPTIESVRCLYSSPVLDGLLLLDDSAAHGFVRDWHVNIGGISPLRHYAYALQWFAMAIAIVVIFLVVNVKRLR